jgi:hypothetical protein
LSSTCHLINLQDVADQDHCLGRVDTVAVDPANADV